MRLHDLWSFAMYRVAYGCSRGRNLHATIGNNVGKSYGYQVRVCFDDSRSDCSVDKGITLDKRSHTPRLGSKTFLRLSLCSFLSDRYPVMHVEDIPIVIGNITIKKKELRLWGHNRCRSHWPTEHGKYFMLIYSFYSKTKLLRLFFFYTLLRISKGHKSSSIYVLLYTLRFF